MIQSGYLRFPATVINYDMNQKFEHPGRSPLLDRKASTDRPGASTMLYFDPASAEGHHNVRSFYYLSTSTVAKCSRHASCFHFETEAQAALPADKWLQY